jgi:ABC-type transporter MlaC component
MVQSGRIIASFAAVTIAFATTAVRAQPGNFHPGRAAAPVSRVAPQVQVAPQVRSAPQVAPQTVAPRIVQDVAQPPVTSAPRFAPLHFAQPRPSFPGISWQVSRTPGFAAPTGRAPPRQPALTRNLGGEPARQHDEGAGPTGTAARNLNPLNRPGEASQLMATFQGRFANRFAEKFRRDRHFRPIVIGWIGPLFWPYAYDDFVDYTFYPYANDTFWPYAYDELYDYAYGLGTGYASVGESQQGPSTSRPVAADVCGGPIAGLTDWPTTDIAQIVVLDDSQRALLDDVKAAAAKTLAILRAACPKELPSTPTGRIEAMHTRLAVMLQAMRIVRPALERFYRSLNDEQKARFNALGPGNGQDQPQAQQDLTQACSERASGIGVPTEEIERAVRPDDAQRVMFGELQNAMSAAVDLLKSNCPTYRALTPVVRMEVIEQRLNALLRAVETVQPALEKFYSSLSDDQKERFSRPSPDQGGFCVHVIRGGESVSECRIGERS